MAAVTFLALTTACRARCFFCTRHDGPEGFHLPEDQVQGLIDGLEDPPGMEVILTGGEPLLSPHVGSAVARLRERGVGTITLETNGWHLRGAFAPARLKAAGIDGVRLLLPSHLPPLYDRITGTVGVLPKIIPALDGLDAHLDLSITIPITAWNAPTLPATVDQARQWFPRLRSVVLSVLDPGEAPVQGRRAILARPAVDAVAARLREACDRPITVEEPPRPDGFGDASHFGVDQTGALTETVVRVNYRCNEKCDWCWVEHEKPDLPREAVLAEVRRAMRLGSRYVTFSGGEPTLWRGLPDLIREVRDLGIQRVGLQTNAVRCAREDYAAQLLDAGLDEAFVSLHGSTPAIADAVTELPGGQEKTVAGLHRLLAGGVEIRINFVIDGRNYRDLPAFVAFCREQFDRYDVPWVLIFSFAHPISSRSRPDHIVPFREVAPFVREALDWCREHGVAFAGLEAQCGIPPCILGGEERYYPRLAGDQGRSHDRDFTYLESCQACARREQCVGIRKSYLDLFGPDEFQPVKREPVAKEPD